jgi:hypothetical protein
MRYIICGAHLSGRCSPFSRCKHILRRGELLALRVPCHLFTRLLAVNRCVKLLLDNLPVWDHVGHSWAVLLVWR